MQVPASLLSGIHPDPDRPLRVKLLIDTRIQDLLQRARSRPPHAPQNAGIIHPA